MIIKEYMLTRQDGVKLYKSYSDQNKYILKEGTLEKYRVAIDVENSNFIYIETDIDLPAIPAHFLTKLSRGGNKHATENN